MSKPKLAVYVSGPYSGDISGNIQRARETAITLWEAGFAVLCPHLNTARFERDCKIAYDDYISGDLRLLEGCDAVFLLKGWAASLGAKEESRHAEDCGIPQFDDIEALKQWAERPKTTLGRAESLVAGDRGRDYGPPSKDFHCAAAMYSAYLRRKYGLEIDLSPEDWPPAMICTKLSRLAKGFKLDSLDDIAGYVRTWEMVMEEK